MTDALSPQFAHTDRSRSLSHVGLCCPSGQGLRSPSSTAMGSIRVRLSLITLPILVDRARVASGYPGVCSPDGLSHGPACRPRVTRPVDALPAEPASRIRRPTHGGAAPFDRATIALVATRALDFRNEFRDLHDR